MVSSTLNSRRPSLAEHLMNGLFLTIVSWVGGVVQAVLQFEPETWPVVHGESDGLLDGLLRQELLVLPYLVVFGLGLGLPSFVILRLMGLRTASALGRGGSLFRSFLAYLVLALIAFGPLSFAAPELEPFRPLHENRFAGVRAAWPLCGPALLFGLVALWRASQALSDWSSAWSRPARGILAVAAGLALGLVVGVPLWMAREPDVQFATSPNLILILVDGLDRSLLAQEGANPTPGLDGFIEESVEFERLVVASTGALESTASIMTGLYPSTHGIRCARPGLEAMRRFAESRPTLAGVLGGEGYDCVL
ncbi:MAG: sulfatase-like hydrolase/transferase, partial [Planctomycetes bacterium]|nr:sulfatase-like hydrolase/transferase [Planctomycetota bacterium]